MREKIPTVTIPYWDSTLDAKLPDPRASILFSPEFMGNGNGMVNTGPSRQWMTPWGPLIRNFGQDGGLMNWTSIRDVFTRRRLSEITMPNAEAKYNFEDIHGEPHLWVGGHMSPQALAGYDPIFFLHHSFIDLLWEIFRMLQRTRGVDPTKDYPNITVPEGHGLNDPSGFGWLSNEQALSDYYTSNIYTYELPPSCTMERPNCGSPYLRCDTSLAKPSCVSLTIFDTQPAEFRLVNDFSNGDFVSRPLENRVRGGNGRLGHVQERTRDTNVLWNVFGGIRRSRRAPHNNGTQIMALSELASIFETSYTSVSGNQSLPCQPNDWNEQYVNNFNINGLTDRKQWVYIPLGILYRKDPERLGFNYHSYLQVYSKCKRGISINPHVSIESIGLNYIGIYKEVIPINKDTPLFSASSFIGVKVPDGNVTDVLLVAYDVCGRVCQPYCFSRLHDHTYQPCNGSIRITSDYPKMYRKSVKELVNDIYQEHNRSTLPELDTKQIFMQFYCNNKEWPWQS
ncbi:hypothetical protein ACJMK2_009981 [Sinanodonta woodiana]|uniref:Tyrosinase copper-binding domain-containing protein n=1 Tax=Sinanodonta woodiana TaxID=1069815 RepID=A0ABD3VDX7_SINWO